jgi:hypothetical protein
VESYGGPHLEKVYILAVPKKGWQLAGQRGFESFTKEVHEISGGE